MLNYRTPTPQTGHACASGRNIMNQNAGTALVVYSSGAPAVCSQNFLPRQSAVQRGATVIGHDATLRVDWQSGTATAIDRHRVRVDRVQVEAVGMLGGGDAMLAKNYVDVLRGPDLSWSPLDRGLPSAEMRLAARDAADSMTQPVPITDGRVPMSRKAEPRGPVEPAPRVGLTITARVAGVPTAG